MQFRTTQYHAACTHIFLWICNFFISGLPRVLQWAWGEAAATFFCRRRLLCRLLSQEQRPLLSLLLLLLLKYTSYQFLYTLCLLLTRGHAHTLRSPRSPAPLPYSNFYPWPAKNSYHSDSHTLSKFCPSNIKESLMFCYPPYWHSSHQHHLRIHSWIRSFYNKHQFHHLPCKCVTWNGASKLIEGFLVTK